MQSRTKVMFVRVTPAEHRALLAAFRKLRRSGDADELEGVGDWMRHVVVDELGPSLSKAKRSRARRRAA